MITQMTTVQKVGS